MRERCGQKFVGLCVLWWKITWDLDKELVEIWIRQRFIHPRVHESGLYIKNPTHVRGRYTGAATQGSTSGQHLGNT